jgi:hypothetical protein
MRPRKVVLIIDPQEDRRGITRFTLWTNFFNAVGVASIHEARLFIGEGLSADVILGYWPIDEAWFAQLGHEFGVPTLYMVDQESHGHRLSNATLHAVHTATFELVERIKILTARKRGPKPKPVISAQPQIEVASAGA